MLGLGSNKLGGTTITMGSPANVRGFTVKEESGFRAFKVRGRNTVSVGSFATDREAVAAILRRDPTKA